MSITLLAIVKLVIVIFLGFYLYKKKILSQDSLDFINRFVIDISLPSLILYQILDNFTVDFQPSLWFFIIVSLGIYLLGIILGYILSLFNYRRLRREFMGLLSFQNCGYLPISIAFVLFNSYLRSTFLIYIFFYLVGFNILIWSIGSFLIFNKVDKKFPWRSIFSLPAVSAIVGIILVYLGVDRFIPLFLKETFKMVGDTTSVFSMLILGGWLARSRIENIFANIGFFIEVGLVKLFIMPLIMLLLIINFKVYSLLGMFLMIEASMPSAVSLPIASYKYEGINTEIISQTVFLTHIFSIITVPLWLEIFLKISGLSF